MPEHTTHHTGRNILIGLVIALAAGLFGAGLARSNSDIICTKTVSDQGACTGGSWGQWSLTGQTPDTNACTITYSETRTYTGIRNLLDAVFQVSANLHTHCQLADSAYDNAQGTITSSYSACQIVESRSRVVNGSGGSCSLPTTGGAGTNVGTVTSDNNIETTSTVVNTSTQMSGTYLDYLNAIDARLATTSIQAVPSLVHSGDKTHIIWASSHVKTCTVTGSNGDGLSGSANGLWNTLMSVSGGEQTSAIVGQTTYTLACKTALGNTIGGSVTVNLVPVFNEQ